ncbi:MAG: hypothetical protein KC731_14245 [Myxococcales bacterium]|nr:hypothetical protein [Myxococcales bacterium]
MGKEPAHIYVYCGTDDDGLDRADLEAALEEFFGGRGEECGGGSGVHGFNVDFELATGEDPHPWVERLKSFLVQLGVSRSTYFDVFPEGWGPGAEWRRVEIFGADQRRTDSPGQRTS